MTRAQAARRAAIWITVGSTIACYCAIPLIFFAMELKP